MNARTALLGVFFLLTLLLGSISFTELTQVDSLDSQLRSVQTRSLFVTTISTIATITTTITTASYVEYSVTFLGPPGRCAIQGLCINATLVNHLGENLTVIAAALFQNATTGQNATIRNSNNSIVFATCPVNAAKPSSCYLIAYPENVGSFRVTIFVTALNTKVVLSPEMTVTVSY